MFIFLGRQRYYFSSKKNAPPKNSKHS